MLRRNEATDRFDEGPVPRPGRSVRRGLNQSDSLRGLLLRRELSFAKVVHTQGKSSNPTVGPARFKPAWPFGSFPFPKSYQMVRDPLLTVRTVGPEKACGGM